MLDLPKNASAYKQTKLFDASSVPKGLLADHQTKAGTWGVIHVQEGQLAYRITEPGFEEDLILGPTNLGIIAPEHKHHVEPLGPVKFYVEFYR